MSSIRGRNKVTERESQLPGEWIVCLLRWGLLACIVVVALLDPSHSLPPSELIPFVAAVAIYNLVIMLLVHLRLFHRFLPFLTLMADILAMIALLHLTGGIFSPYVLFTLFPLLVGVLRFGWQAGLLTAGVFVLDAVLLTAMIWEAEQAPELLFQLGWHVLLFPFVVAVAGVVNERVLTAAKLDRQTGASRSQIRPEHLQMVYDLASSLSATLNYERVLEAILDISRLGFDELGMRLGESVGLVLLYDKDGQLKPASHRNLVTREDEVRRIKGSSGIVAEAIASGQAVIGEAPASDPQLRAFDSLQQARSMICVPLRAGFETYGVVLFATVKRQTYTMEHVELLTLFCNQATIALQNASLYRSLREERDKIVGKEEAARHKLARELHDGPTQDVAAIAMRLNFARLLLEKDPGRAKVELERLEDLAHRTVREIRSMLFALRPVILETEGLLAALSQYAENMREIDSLPMQIDAETYQDCLNSETQGVVFAILEEAINNARKHAQASRIWVRIAVEGDLFVAEVIDNGRGFDTDAVAKSYSSRGSLGMVNLKERADLVGGTINIDSAPGQGACVTLLVPLTEETSKAP
jgi:signal transduction histidine kinase